MTGAAVIVNVTAFDIAPGVGFTTVTDTVPAVATSAAGTRAVSCVEEINVVVRLVLPNITTDPETKLVPVTVKVKSALPGATQLGLIDVMVGFLPIVMTRVAVEVLQGLVPLLTVIVTL